MSLSIFAVRNQWYKNGKNGVIKEFGGLPRWPTGLSGNRPMTP
jgi:hypothetical protein